MLGGRRARIAAALAIAAAAAVTAGCGGGGSALALDPVAAAATKTQHAGAARVRLSLAFSAPRQQNKTITIRGTGAIDGTSGELTVDPGSMLQQAGLPAGGSIKAIFLEENGDLLVYAQLGALAAQIPGGKPWLELDVSKLAKAEGLDLSRLLSGSQLQPTDLLSMLKTEGAGVSEVGPATVDGIPTTHYHVTVDLAKALEARGLSSPLLAVVAAQTPTLPEDVWIGKDGLVHRLQLAVSVQHQGKPVRLAVTMDLYDYGARVTIAAPPANDVFDATQLAQQRLGSAFGG